MGSPRATLQFLLNPSQPAYTAQMQSPDSPLNLPDDGGRNALIERMRKAKNACFLLATSLYRDPRFKGAYSSVKDLLSMDDMSTWSLHQQACEWEAKFDLLQLMDADNPERAASAANPATADRSPIEPLPTMKRPRAQKRPKAQSSVSRCTGSEETGKSRRDGEGTGAPDQKRLRIAGYKRAIHVQFSELIPSHEGEIRTEMAQMRFRPPFNEPQGRT